jgi:hypothetical protein
VSSKATFDQWVREYQRLNQTRHELETFIGTRYEEPLAAIAREWAHSREASLPLPCHECKVQVSTLIDDKGWYFEWECPAAVLGCGSGGHGWYVPLDVIHAELGAVLPART